MKNIVFASNNKGKIAEVKAILGEAFNILSMKEAGLVLDIDESGATFEDNAYLKAKGVYDALQGTEYAAAGIISDDSGLVVEALGGAPGVYSAMYAKYGDDEANNKKLLDNMCEIANRAAKFVCVACYIDADGFTEYFYGETHGMILKKGEGNNGFGYDSLFFSHELQKTFGQAGGTEKNLISHRGKAFGKLIKYLILR